MITYKIGVEVTCQGIGRIFVGYETGSDPEQAQGKALDRMQNLEQHQADKELRTFEIIQCVRDDDWIGLDEWKFKQL